MSNIRRWYFYLVSAISLQAVTWAVIALLRNLLFSVFNLTIAGSAAQTDLIALQIAVIIVGVPLFYLHWRWATRSEAELEEQDHLRVLYLYAMLSAFLLPLIFNARGVLEAGLRLLFGLGASYGTGTLTGSATFAGSATAIVILALFAAVHWRMLGEERPFAPPVAVPAGIHRLFLYLFSALGLVFLTIGAINLLSQLWEPVADSGFGSAAWAQIASVALLLTGLVVWLLFWHAAQRLFRSGDPAEQGSVLRKGYLYLVIFVTLIAFVSAAAVLLAGVFKQVLGVETPGGAGIVLATLIVTVFICGYHTLVLREDAQTAPELEEQTAIHRLYWYVLAAVGLLATLIGLGGVISVAVNAATQPGQVLGGNALREQLAWFAAVLLVGLPLWIVAWRQIQAGVEAAAPAGLDARRAPVRRLYLYGFILLATLSFLGCAVFIVYRALSGLLGEPLDRRDVTQLALAGAYALMAVLVWLYHGRLLRADNEAHRAALPPSATAPRLVLLDDGDGRFAQQLEAALREAFPAATVQTLGLNEQARLALLPADGQPATAELLREADVIISPWTATSPYVGPPLPATELGAAFATSTARKLLVPFALPGWDWTGVDPVGMETAVAQAVQAVKQIVAGEPVRPRAPLGAGRILLLLLAAFIFFNLVVALISRLMFSFGLD